MIRILAKEYSKAVATLCEKLNKQSAQYDMYLCQSTQNLIEILPDSVTNSALIIVGGAEWCTTFAETFGLSLVYDSYAEKNVKEYCKLINQPQPAQYLMDKYCMLPETFIHYTSVFGIQCGCSGEYAKCHIYILPDDHRECSYLFDNYIVKDLFKMQGDVQSCCFKLFGLSAHDLGQKLTKLSPKFVTLHTETINLDSKVTVTFSRNCAKKVIKSYTDNFIKEFQAYVYADSEQSLAQTVVKQLNSMYKTLATAESITGGLVASSIVDVPGASNVLYEGAVTYSIDAKCNRLGISPHFIDEYGVVSAQVAKEMATSQLKNADFSIATTGYAGPTSDAKNPVGLCFIGIGAKIDGKCVVKVFKNVFTGDRNSIRSQVANTALYLLYNALNNSEFYTKK